MLHRLRVLIAFFLLTAAASVLAAPVVTVYKDPNCGCCGEWVKHLQSNGLQTRVHDVSDLDAIKQKLRVPERLGSCHTAVVNGYTIEGHVPAADIKRLLAAKPKARGLAVPGMPQGSPGMETGKIEAYEVLLFTDTGTTTVFSRHGK